MNVSETKENFSLIKDIKVPKDWTPHTIDPEDFKLKIEKYKNYGIENKLFSINDSESKKEFTIKNHIVTRIVLSFYPFITIQEFEIAWLLFSAFINLDRFSDELIENGEDKKSGGEISRNAKSIIKTLENILLLPNYLLPIKFSFKEVSVENLFYLLKLKTYIYCKQYGIESIGETMMAHLIEFIENFEPFNNFKINDENMETYFYLRKTNIGIDSCLDFALMLSIRKMDPMVFYASGLYRKLSYRLSKHITVVNDIVSYEKEVALNSIGSNILNQLIVGEKKLTFKQAYHYLLNYHDVIVFEILELVDQHTKEVDNCKSCLSQEDLIEFKNSMKRLLYCCGGNFTWGTECIRYATKDSVFIELKQLYETYESDFFKNKSFIKI